MTRFLACLLTLLFSLSSPAMEGNADFGHSSLAAKGPLTTLYRAVGPDELADISAAGALVRHPALVGVFEFDDSVRQIITRVGPRFWDWYGPNRGKLPEDICLLSGQGKRLVFASNTHKLDGWIFTKERLPFGVPTPGWIRKDFVKVVFSGAFYCRLWSGTGRLYRPLKGKVI